MDDELDACEEARPRRRRERRPECSEDALVGAVFLLKIERAAPERSVKRIAIQGHELVRVTGGQALPVLRDAARGRLVRLEECRGDGDAETVIAANGRDLEAMSRRWYLAKRELDELDVGCRGERMTLERAQRVHESSRWRDRVGGDRSDRDDAAHSRRERGELVAKR